MKRSLICVYVQKHHATYAILSNTLEDLKAEVANNALLVSDQSFNTTRRSLGEALALVKHIPMTNENYSEAWDKLENRYNKKPLINR